MKQFCFAALGAASIAFAAPAAAQSEWPVEPDGYVDVGMIEIQDGHSLEYANYLAANWRKQQDYAKSQGWITNYQIWQNSNKRPGEADLFLVTWFPKFADKEEGMRREKAFQEYMATNVAKMQAESGKRATYRKQLGSMLFDNLTWAKK